TLIGLAAEKIVILLADKVLGSIDHVCGRFAGVVKDGNHGCRRSPQIKAHGIAQVDVESLSSFDIRVVIDENGERLRSVARRKAQRTAGSDVVSAISCGAI